MDHRRGFCGWCVRAAKWIPVLFISAIVSWSYYAYVVRLCFLTTTSMAEQVTLLSLYHVFFGLFVWSYWKTVITEPGRVPRRFYLTTEEMDRIEGADNHRAALEQIVVDKDLPCTMRSLHQEIRYCSECSLIKPDRAHHCSVCGGCVLKMDHHCPWVNNCVAFSNYKFFVLFLGYALLYCIYVSLSTLKYFLLFWTTAVRQSGDTGKFHVLFLFFVSVMFSISLASLFFYHLYLVSKNLTTLEAFRTPITRNGPDKQIFHLGKQNNFQEVFGDNSWLWFLPVFTSFGDGVIFPQRGQLDEEAGLLAGGSSPPGQSTLINEEEERVPMMPHRQTNGARWKNGAAVAPAADDSSSSTSEENGLPQVRRTTSLEETKSNVTHVTQDLVAVNM